MTETQSVHSILSSLDQSLKREFDSQQRVLTYDEYLHLFFQNPRKQSRASGQYLADMMDFFGKSPLPESEGSRDASPSTNSVYRFHLFDLPIDGLADKLVGHEEVQTQIYRALRGFASQGVNTKLILLHGPNGSAKTTIMQALMGGLERYSQEPDGAIYTYQWVFPMDRISKGGIGIQSSYVSPSGKEITSYARLTDDDVAARVPCEFSDHPILLIPAKLRTQLFEKLLGTKESSTLAKQLPHHLLHGEPCHRCKQISDALLKANQGELQKVLRHVQVERTTFSRRYRRGLVTIEPQMHVDAQMQQLTMNRSYGQLPASLQSLNLFSVSGDLVDGNRGMVEFNDMLKRPIDSFKYLLSACERGLVNIGNSIAYLDTVFFGSCNEQQLDGFKEFPDFGSFKARMDLVRVPYLMSFNQEKQIYESMLSRISDTKHAAPHVAWALGLWSVLTRLKKPNPINYPPTVSAIVSSLSPIEKARLYDSGELPVRLSAEDRKLLRSNLRRIRDEYSNIPYYEGRMGASVREARTLLLDASQNPEFRCVSPLSVMREMEKLVKRVSEYEFLRQEVKDTYHDAAEFIHVVRNEYLDRIDREVRESIGLYDSKQWEEFLKKYIHNISH